MSERNNYRTAVAEGRVLAALRRSEVRGDTIVGSVEAHTIRRDGVEMIRVTRTEAWDLTREQWDQIATGLHLDVAKG